MTFTSNQFELSANKGSLDLNMNPNVITCRVAQAQATALTPGMAVKLADTASKIPEVVAAGATDAILGFVCYNIKGNEFSAGDAVEIAFDGAAMYMEASAAIAAGANVMIVVSGTKVATQTASNTIVGTALDKAGTTGDLIRVIIKSVLITGAFTPSDNSVSAAKLTTDAVETAKIKAKAVTAAKLEDNIALNAPDLTAGVAAHDYASAHADWTLSATEAKALILTTASADASANIVATPTAGKLYIVANSSGQANVIKASGQTGVTVASTKTAIVRGNGTDFARVTADA